MKRMLFNATQAEELRVAIVDGQKLIDLDIESASKEQRKSNIYKAVITRIEPSLEAAFVDYGAERHGFLPFKEVSRAYFKSEAEPHKARIQDALSEGQELIVQVEKDERGNKGAALTTFISLAGRYLVLMPNNPRGGGVSRRVEGEDRAELREIMDQLNVSQGMSLIARTAGIGRTFEELQWDLNYLMQLWRAIESAATSQPGPFLIYQEGSLVIRAIRDYFHPDIGEILIDTDDIYDQARQFMGHVMPGNVARVKRYRDDVPLFSRFQIEHQIESAFARQVALPSGGAVVIDHTEALVSIDVNSGRATRGADIEETAVRTNLEASDEIARQLRLRDLGGLIVIDFIDMENQRNQREVESRLREALHYDRARVQMGKISRFGLLELSRQRLRPALAETSYIPCPRCMGTGHIRSTESAALHILRILEEEAMKENTGAIHAQIPVDVATFLLNEKRTDIHAIELRHKVNIFLIPNVHIETPAHEIVRLRHDQLNQEEVVLPSYKMMEAPPQPEGYQPSAQPEPRAPRQEAAVKGITPEQPAPLVDARSPYPAASRSPAPPAAPPKHGIMHRIVAWFRGNREQAEPVINALEPAPQRATSAERDARRGGRGRRNDQGRPDRGERGPRPVHTDQAERDARPVPARSASSGEPREQRRGRPPRNDARGEPRGGRPARLEQDQAGAVLAADVGVAASVLEVTALSGGGTEAAAEGQGRSRRGRRGGRRERQEPRVDQETPAISSIPAMAGEDGQATPAEPLTAAAGVSAEETSGSVSAEPVADAERVLPALPPIRLGEPEIVEPSAAASHADPLAASAPPPVLVTEMVEPAGAGSVAELPHVESDPGLAQATRQEEPPPVQSIDLAAALEQSGLVLVETSPGRTQADQSDQAPPAQQRRRRAEPAQPVSEEPLVQVETRK